MDRICHCKRIEMRGLAVANKGMKSGKAVVGDGFSDLTEENSSQALKLNLCGPSRDVRFKDRIYLVSFIFSVGFLVVAAASISHILPPYRRLEHTDSWGNQCGKDNRVNGVEGQYTRDLRGQRSTFFAAKTETFRFLRQDTRNQYFVRLCVKECPNLAMECEDFLKLNGYDNINDTRVLKKRVCIGYLDLILPHTTDPVPDLVCTPSVISLVSTYDDSGTPEDKQGFSWLAHTIISSSDTIYYNRKLIALFICMATLISYIFAFMIFLIPRFSPYYFALFSIHICVLSVIVCFYKINQISSFETLEAKDGSIEHLVDRIYYRKIDNYVAGNETWLDGAKDMKISALYDITSVTGAYGSRKEKQSYIIAVAFTIAFCVCMMIPEIFALREYYIDCATLMFQVMTTFHKNIPLIFAIPLVTAWANFLLYWYFTVVLFPLFVPHTSERDGDGIEIVIQTTPGYMYLLRFVIIACMLWVAEFCRGCEHYLIAGCVIGCYFDRHKKVNILSLFHIKSVVVKLVGRCMGQIAFGSSIVIMCLPIRAFLYVFHIFFSAEMCNCHGLFQLRKAYLSVALFGDGYRSAWKRTRALLIQHATFALETTYMMGFYIILVRISVTVLTTVAFLMISRTKWYTVSESAGVPVFEIGLASWFVSTSILNVQHVSHNALIYCYCVDMEGNNGRELPYSSPKYIIKAMENLKEKVNQRQLHREQRRKKPFWHRMRSSWRNAEAEETVSHFTYQERVSLADLDTISQ